MIKSSGTLRVQTPEGISFSFLLATPVSRLLAWVIDLACIVGATGVITRFLSLLKVLSPDVAQAATVVIYFVISIGYGIAFEWYWRGQTLGKRTLRLRVLDAQGLHLKFDQVVLRNLFRFVDGLPVFYMLGGVACLLTRNAQRIGDIAANTIVVRNPKPEQPDVEQLLRSKYNSFRDYPHLAARLRQRVPSDAVRIALEALIRREEFDPQARVALFAEIVASFRSIVEFPPEATEQISDEQYVRNVLELLFEAARAGRVPEDLPRSLV